jgi:6-phosphogluconolactonase (cycloisomerase 2 family)
VLSNDLGNDKVYSYEYNPNSASTVLKEKDSFAVEAGSGPRHLTFSKRELCLCITGTYWRSDGLFLFERKVEKNR